MIRDNPTPPIKVLPGPRGATTLPFELIEEGGHIKIRWFENGHVEHCNRAHHIMWNEYIRLYDFILASTEMAEPGVMDRWREMHDYIMLEEYETSY
jgi:hypothetical protein